MYRRFTKRIDPLYGYVSIINFFSAAISLKIKKHGGNQKMTVFITGIASGFDVELARVFAENRYKVYAGDAGRGCDAREFAEIVDFNPDSPESIDEACERLLQNPAHIDIYINTGDYKVPDSNFPDDNFTVSDDIDYETIKSIYNANVLWSIAMYEGFLPLVKNGGVKRYCFITNAKASVNHCADITGYGYNMSKAGLHNFLQIIKNKLMPDGFTFRAFDPSSGELPDEEASRSAFNYFTRRRGVEGGRDDEPKLVIRDAFGRQHSW
jgi:NAD(P)-dependent dehydrogenase (short-subunit alcohol dehydrogenase family)